VARVALGSLAPALAKEARRLNVSYDPMRELHSEFNAAFAKYWKVTTGDTAIVQQSPGGSGKQAHFTDGGTFDQTQRAAR